MHQGLGSVCIGWLSGYGFICFLCCVWNWITMSKIVVNPLPWLTFSLTSSVIPTTHHQVDILRANLCLIIMCDYLSSNRTSIFVKWLMSDLYSPQVTIDCHALPSRKKNLISLCSVFLKIKHICTSYVLLIYFHNLLNAS